MIVAGANLLSDCAIGGFYTFGGVLLLPAARIADYP